MKPERSFGQWKVDSVANEDRSVFFCSAADGRQSVVKIPRRGALSVWGRPDAAQSRQILEYEAERLKAWQTIDGIVRIYEWQPKGRTPYLAIERLGESLDDVIPQDGMEPDAVFRMIVEVARTLEQIHARNEAHHDLKPANICLRGSGSWVLIDPAPEEMTTEDYGPSQFTGYKRDLVALGRIFIVAWTGVEETELTLEYQEPLSDMVGDRWARCLRGLLRGRSSATAARRAATDALRSLLASPSTAGVSSLS